MQGSGRTPSHSVFISRLDSGGRKKKHNQPSSYKATLVNLTTLANIYKFNIGEKMSVPHKYCTSTMTCIFVHVYM